MKKTINILLSMLLFLSACDGTEKSDKDSGGHTSESFKIVKENIDVLGKKPWNKSAYLNIKDNQIPELRKETERKSASEHLNRTYGDLMIKEVKTILNGNCDQDKTHVRLNSLFNELKGFSDNPGFSEAARLKKAHDEAVTFAHSGIANQSVRSYRDAYDTSYETSKKQRAQALLNNSSVKCNATRQKLQTLTTDNAYQSRRRAYCESITREYLSCTNPAKSELNAALGKLTVYKGSTTDWEARMRQHYNDIQPKK